MNIECDKCKVAMVPIQKRRAASFAGVLGWVIVLIGIGCLFFNAILGALGLIVGLIIGFSGDKKTVLICPQCKSEGITL